MAVKWFKKDDTVPLREIPVRVQKMTREDLILWADTVIMQTGASFDAWRFRDAPVQDAVMAAETLAAILTELQAREKLKSNT